MGSADLVVASNRGPVSFDRDDDGDIVASRGSGGLIVALGGALLDADGTWVSVALGDEDREMAERNDGEAFEVDTDAGSYTVKLVDVGDKLEGYYNHIANRQLWFTVHELWGAPYTPTGRDWKQAWTYAYEAVNGEIADAVVAEASETAEIYLQDYHLCTTASSVRSALPDSTIAHYLHTPWVGPDYFRMLPDPISHGVLEGLLAADLVGFSAPEWCDAFRRCCAELLGAEVSGERVRYQDRETQVADFRLGISPETLTERAHEEDVEEALEELDEQLDGRRLIFRADRSDLSKNILRGLFAYEQLLEQRPEHRDQTHHLALIDPSRQDVPEYAEYLERCEEKADEIRERFGAACLSFEVGSDYPRVLAGFRRYDVLFVNPVIDGTNLVAKEGPTVNERDGVLVLSRKAGAAAALGDGPISINPYDVADQVDALDEALSMGAKERGRRAEILRTEAERGSPADWFAGQRHLLRAAAVRRT